MTYDEAWAKLARSKFRSRFHLGAADREYCCRQGLAVIREHAAAFVRTRLAPAHPDNDGRQTPMRGHPVFIAQHATALCCRGCLSKWWHAAAGRELTAQQQEKIVNFLMAWIQRELGAGPETTGNKESAETEK